MVKATTEAIPNTRKWPGPGLEGKVQSFSVCNDCNGGGDDQTQNRKNLEIEKVNVQGQHPGSAECAAAIE